MTSQARETGTPLETAQDRLLTIGEVAEYLAIPVATLYQWRHRGEGPRGMRVGGRHVRYRPGDVEAWLDACGDDPRPAA